MSFAARLKEARLVRALTQEQLGARVGLSKSTIAGYEKGVSEPAFGTIAQLMQALGVDANYLWQDDFAPQNEANLSAAEYIHIRRYRRLDDFGRQTVNLLLARELHRCTELNAAHAGQTPSPLFAAHGSDAPEHYTDADQRDLEKFLSMPLEGPDDA